MNSEHSRHDRLLVARYAADDSYPTERDQAERLISGCDECAALAADIKLISARTSEMTQVRRPRDFRISPEQAEQLRGSWLDRMLRGLSAPGWTVVRPLAGAALAVSLALVVIGALPLGNIGAAGQDAAQAPVAAENLGGMPSSQTAIGAPSQQPRPQPSAPSDYYAAGSPSAPSATGAGQSTTIPEMQTMGPGPDANVDSGSAPPTDVKAGDPTATTRPETDTTPAPPTAAPATPAPSAPGRHLGGATTSSPPADNGGVPATDKTAVPTTTQSSLDRNALINAGLLLGFLALLVLGIVWGLRSRYSDPLAR